MNPFLPATLNSNGAVPFIVGGSPTADVYIGPQAYMKGCPLSTDAAIATSDVFQNGMRFTQAGLLRTYDATSAIPAGAIVVDGFAYTSTGQLCYTNDDPTSATMRLGGVAVRSDGAVHAGSPENWWVLPWLAEGWDVSSGLSVTGGVVDTWTGAKGLYTFSASGGARPSYASSVITFNGSSQYLYTGAITLNQPWTATIVGTPNAWTVGATAMDGATTNSARLFQVGVSPEVDLNAGSSGAGNTGWGISTAAVVFAGFSGASSFIQVGSNAATTGDAGAGNAGGVTLGVKGDRATEWWSGSVEAVAISTALLSAAERSQTLRALQRRFTSV